eukprot:TRINITY_DN6714_c0_g1_i19.p1 TRINITY_DN6714_c0_g1~~TRINITY_DN6714_c0_g1_i19.p1  ORF type:complete len:137 (+),score=30.74 TRINITY_DN6714_c0_g1_i19:140-550(+)
MVTKWGMSNKLGPLSYSEDNGEVFLGKSVTQTKSVSDDTAHAIDLEVRGVIEHNYGRAKQILVDNMEKLHMMAEALLKYETIDSDQIRDIMEGRQPGPPESWNDNNRSNPPPRSTGSGTGAGAMPPVNPRPAGSPP